MTGRRAGVRAALVATLCALSLLAAALVGLPRSSSAAGCTITWVGDVNNAWNAGQGTADTNWSDNTIPDGNDQVCLTSAGNQPITVTGSVVVEKLTVESGATFEDAAEFRATTDSTNAGTIKLTVPQAVLTIADFNNATTETLTNTGTIEAKQTTGQQILGGDVLNQGTVSVAHPDLKFWGGYDSGRNPTFTNSGTLTLASTGEMIPWDGGKFTQAPGGTIGGSGILQTGTSSGSFGGALRISGGTIQPSAHVNLGSSSPLEFVNAGSAQGKINVLSTTHYLQGATPADAGNIPAGIAVEIPAGGELLSRNNFTNAGTILLSGSNSTLVVEDQDPNTTETLTNTGNIVSTGSTGDQGIAGDVINQGTIGVSHPSLHFQARFENRISKLTNTASGTINVSAGGLLYAPLAQSLPNAGTIQLSGKLWTSAYSQVAGATLAVRVGGPNPGTDPGFGQLKSDGNVSLAGKLTVATSGYTPATGQPFKIVDAAGSRTGTFSPELFSGRAYDVNYNPNDVTLAARAPSSQDTDTDGDFFPDVSDNCPTTPNPDQADSDHDGTGDACDTADSDNDGVPDASDNCPFNANPGQQNSDGANDGGDACDSNDDNDALPDTSDSCPTQAAATANGCPALADTDNDGVPDGSDNCPTTANSNQKNTDGDSQGDACDSNDDNDALPDSTDACPTQAANTPDGCPGLADGDGDGIPDQYDNCPTVANPEHVNTDGDAEGDACDSDDDNDGKADSVDKCPTQAANTADGCPVVPPPKNTAPPQISGTPAPGEALSCSLGSWDGAPTRFAHQWKRNGAPIPGATSSIYSVAEADIDKVLSCTVTATSAAGSTDATSEGLNVRLPVPVPIEQPSIRGKPFHGDYLTCDPGRWAYSPSSFSYSWTLGGHPSNPFTRRQSFTVPIHFNFLNAGRELTCEVKARNGAGEGTALARATMGGCSYLYHPPGQDHSQCSDTPIPELQPYEQIPTNRRCQTLRIACTLGIPVEFAPGVPYQLNGDGSVTVTYVSAQGYRTTQIVNDYYAELLRGGAGATTVRVGAETSAANRRHPRLKRVRVSLGTRRFRGGSLHTVRLRLPRKMRRALRRRRTRVYLVTRETAATPGKSSSRVTTRLRLVLKPRRCVVPRLTGRSLTAALRVIRRTRCKVGPIAFQSSTSEPADRVIAQSPGAGRKRRAGTAVNLTVSRGPPPS